MVFWTSNTFEFPGHVYAITQVVPKFQLVRLINPHGKNPWSTEEWTGSWSDNSKEWEKLTKQELLDLDPKKKGEFFMDIKDFVRIFDLLSICYIKNLKPGLEWYEENINGSWIAKVSAGT